MMYPHVESNTLAKAWEPDGGVGNQFPGSSWMGEVGGTGEVGVQEEE